MAETIADSTPLGSEAQWFELQFVADPLLPARIAFPKACLICLRPSSKSVELEGMRVEQNNSYQTTTTLKFSINLCEDCERKHSEFKATTAALTVVSCAILFLVTATVLSDFPGLGLVFIAFVFAMAGMGVYMALQSFFGPLAKAFHFQWLQSFLTLCFTNKAMALAVARMNLAALRTDQSPATALFLRPASFHVADFESKVTLWSSDPETLAAADQLMAITPEKEINGVRTL